MLMLLRNRSLPPASWAREGASQWFAVLEGAVWQVLLSPLRLADPALRRAIFRDYCAHFFHGHALDHEDRAIGAAGAVDALPELGEARRAAMAGEVAAVSEQLEHAG